MIYNEKYKRLHERWMNVGRIGFATVSHPDYQRGGAVERIRQMAVDQLRRNGVEVYSTEEIIYSSRDAERAGKQLLREDVDGIILFLGSWIECPVAMSLIREVENMPLLLWGFPMLEVDGQLMSTGSYVTYTMFKGVLDRVGYTFKGILGEVDQEKTIAEIKSFCTAATTYQRLKRSKVGMVGYTSMSIYTGTFDHVLLRVKIGPEVEHIDAYSLIKIAEAMDPQRIPQIQEKLRAKTKIDKNVTQPDLDKISRLFYALMELKESKELDAINVKCQYEFSKEYGMVMCVPLSLAAEEGIVSSCEGDMMNTISMMILNLLSGKVVTYGDAIHHSGNTLKLSACGFLPFSLGETDTQYIQPFNTPGFTGTQTSFVMRPEQVTIMRLVEDVGGYHIIYMTGNGKKTSKRDGCFPALDIELDGDINRLVDAYSGQHYAICYGDYSKEIEDLARILKIKTVKI